MTRALFQCLALILIAVFAVTSPSRADDTLDARHVINEASITVDRIRSETSKSGELDNLLGEAKGVLIVPSFNKGAFIIGVAFGDGVLLSKQPDGTFGDPAFYRMTGGSLGLQIGMQSAEIVFVIRTEKGLSAVLNDEFKIGARADIAMGTIGAGAEAATTTSVGKDIVAYSKNAGLFAGGSLEGAAIKPRKDWNAAVYGVDADPRVIIQRSKLKQAAVLKESLGRGPAAAAINAPGAPAMGSNYTPPASMPDASMPASSPGAVTSQPLSSPVQPETGTQ